MTHFDSVTVFAPAFDLSMTYEPEVTRATNVAFESDSGTVHSGYWLCLRHPGRAGSGQRLEGRLGPQSTDLAAV